MMIASSSDPVLQVLRQNQRRKVFPGGVLCASHHGIAHYHHAVGFATYEPTPIPITTSALFDVASLTKPVATTAALMLLVDSGDIELDDRISKYLPVFAGTDKEALTIRHLLNHCSGFPAHIKFYEQLEELREKGEGPPLGSESVDWVLEQIASMETEPPETQATYSDLGFITLGRLVEKVSGQPLQDFCEEQIFRPLGMKDTFFLPMFEPEKRARRLAGRQVVVTEMCPWRKKLIMAEVHDENCYSFGGVAGHAGLFSTAADIHRFALTLMRCSLGMDTFFPASLVQEFWRKQELVPGSTWALGWDTPSAKNSQVGELFSRYGVGHLGFTGCSLWIDREDFIIAVFLSNRVHPTRENAEIRRLRPLLHNSLYGMLTEPAPLQPPVELGRAPELLQVQDKPALSANQATHSRLRPPPSLRSAFPLSGEQSFDNLLAVAASDSNNLAELPPLQVTMPKPPSSLATTDTSSALQTESDEADKDSPEATSEKQDDLETTHEK